MWDDEPSPWDTDEPAAAEEGEAAAGDGTAAPAAKGAAAAEEKYDWRAANLPKADLPHYTLHWVRPLVLNYRYIYDYR